MILPLEYTPSHRLPLPLLIQVTFPDSVDFGWDRSRMIHRFFNPQKVVFYLDLWGLISSRDGAKCICI